MPSSRVVTKRLLRLDAIEQRIFVLHRRDLVNLVGAADGLRRRLAQAEEAHLALRDELRHRADGVLDRHRRVDAMLVVEVDHVDAEALEAQVAGG